jgi:uncharacterized protein
MSETASATPAAPEGLRPVSAAERVDLLDVLRGFALYGVLLANTIPWYSGRAFLPRAEVAFRPGSPDNIALVLVAIFVDGKAMTLFSFLFGLGFAVQLLRAEARGGNAIPVYLRRLGVLFLIGLCHITLLWWGDILAVYALTGFALILFRRRGDRALLLWAAALLVPFCLIELPAVSGLLERIAPNHRHDDAWRAQVFAALSGHDRVLLTEMQVRQYLAHLGPHAVVFFPSLLGRFLLGYVAGRRRLLHDAAEHLPVFRKLLRWGLAIGLVGGIAMVVKRIMVRHGARIPSGIALPLSLTGEIAVLALAAAYMSALALLFQRPAWRRRLMILAPVGQMALTNYLSQSLICTSLFYGWGLGLLGRVGPALCIPLTLAIFAGQILVSRSWLRRFRFGPMEWLWRSLTYGQAQPMRRAEAVLRPD